MKGLAIMIAIHLCALVAACGPNTPNVCDRSLLPYQYEVRSENDHYFATLIPIESKGNIQTFFLSETLRPLTDSKPLLGGDPAGGVVTFERTEKGVNASQLGLSITANELSHERPSTSSGKSSEVIRFETGGVEFSLASCDGIFSQRFKSDFPQLFD